MNPHIFLAALIMLAATEVTAQSMTPSGRDEDQKWPCEDGSEPRDCVSLQVQPRECGPSDESPRCSFAYGPWTERCTNDPDGNGCDMVYLPEVCKSKPDLPQCKPATAFLPDVCKFNRDLPQCKPDGVVP